MKTQKQIDSNESRHWHSPLLTDLSFIKKHLRYPINKRTITALLIIIALCVYLLWISRLIVKVSFRSFKTQTSLGDMLIGYFAIGVIVFLFLGMIYRRINNLRFISVPSDFGSLENIALLKLFFNTKQIAFHYSADAPEVFQIASVVLNEKYQTREIMVFIADDKRILVNNHFSSAFGDRRGKVLPSKEHKRMADALKAWLAAHRQAHSSYFNEKVIGK